MISSEQLIIAAQYIKEGKLVAFPTDTVYGLGADALNPMAVAKIFDLKGRPGFDPLIVHISSPEEADKLVKKVDLRIKLLAERFWPGPLTVVVPKSSLVPDIVSAGLSTVGIRIPDNEIALQLIKLANCPIAAPSANKFGCLSPTSAQHVSKQLPNVDLILDGGHTKTGIESTVIALYEEGFEVLRHGPILREEIETIIPYYSKINKDENSMPAPGMLKSHYSPNKAFYILGESVPPNLNMDRAGFLAFSSQPNPGFGKLELLTQTENLKEYAVNMFAAIHRMEEADIDFIVAEPVPEIGVGIAIMDRLRKAAYRYTQV